MKAEAYHASLKPLEEACRLARSDWHCIPNPMVGWGREGRLGWKAGVLLRHVLLVFRVWQCVSHRHLLVREFSSIPLLVVFPLLWPLRKRLYFMLHHNLQWAQRSCAEMLALRLLAFLGAKWAMLETQDFSGLERLCIPSKLNLVVPHPVASYVGDGLGKRVPTIGVAGYYRKEKGMDELIWLLKEAFPVYKVLLGVPNPEVVKHLPVEVVSTATDAEYHAMLARCDVLVQNGERESYYFRASGPIADAVLHDTAVVAPDYPLIRHQLTRPVPIGEVFNEANSLEACVQRAVEQLDAGQYAFGVYCNGRSAQALADCLDEFVNEAR